MVLFLFYLEFIKSFELVGLYFPLNLEFGGIISSNIVLHPCSSLLRILIIHMLDLLILLHGSLRLCSLYIGLFFFMCFSFSISINIFLSVDFYLKSSINPSNFSF